VALSLGAIVLRVADLDRMVAFWSAALDLVPREEPADDWASLRPRAGGAVALGSFVAPELLEEIAGILRDAQRPLILAGNGARSGGAPGQLVSVADRLRCPVATTPKGKGVFPEDHPLALGVLGLGGHRSARRYLEHGVDVVLAVGPEAAGIAAGARAVPQWSGTVVTPEGRDEALAWVRQNVAAGGGGRDGVVLVKASRGAALESVAEGLLEGEEGSR